MSTYAHYILSASGWLGCNEDLHRFIVVFEPYRDLEAGDNQSLKFKWRGGESNTRPLALQAMSLTTRPLPLRIVESNN